MAPKAAANLLNINIEVLQKFLVSLSQKSKFSIDFWSLLSFLLSEIPKIDATVR